MSIFNKIPRPKVGRSTFNLSYERKMSLQMGKLYPMHVQEVVPGDEFNHSTQQMLRFMPLIAPVMHEVNVFTHFFFVPNRLTDPQWEPFITGGEDGLSNAIPPQIGNPVVGAGDLLDYLGLPQIQDQTLGIRVNARPLLAYNEIYNEYYRDQNLIEPIKQPWKNDDNVPAMEGVVDITTLFQQYPDLLQVKRRAWQHDYFTSALPFAQKGSPVRIPLINNADQYLDVEFDRTLGLTRIGTQDGNVSPDGSGLTAPAGDTRIVTDTTGTRMLIDNSDQLRVPLASLDVNAANINDLRKAFKIQEWLELAARGGSRYVEMIKSFFGVQSSDARMQRPEYLGGGMSPVMISETLQTSETENSPQGNMAGHGLNLGKGHSYKRRFEEHGYIIGIMSIMPKTAYQQGIPRHYLKKDKFDYFFPQFEHIGEQGILNQELYIGPNREYNDGTFGYIPRYAEYKYNPSTVHGEMKTTLDFWHLGRIFETPPQLNRQFIEANPSKRIFAVEDETDNLVVHIWHNITAKRPMSYFGDPSFRI